MVGTVDILASIVAKIREKVPEVKIYSQDIEEGYKRPCFYIELGDIKLEDAMGRVLEREVPVRITYFPTDRKNNQRELLEVQDKLNLGFLSDKKINITDTVVVEPYGVSIAIVDKILHFDFKLFLAEEYEREEYEHMMEDIEIN